MAQTNVPSKPYKSSGSTITKSPLKDSVRSGNGSTMRDTKKK